MVAARTNDVYQGKNRKEPDTLEDLNEAARKYESETHNTSMLSASSHLSDNLSR